MGLPPSFHFDRSKPFYPWVVNYLLAFWAAKELAAYGVGVRQRLGEIPREENIPTLEELVPALNLQTSSRGPIPVDAEAIGAEISRLPYFHLEQVVRAGGGLLILAYEETKAHSDQGELWEFFRHCRHAAAHRSEFRFVGKEPRHRAAWQRKTIHMGLQGTPLFRLGTEPGLLEVGDPIALLWDIEQATPTL